MVDHPLQDLWNRVGKPFFAENAIEAFKAGMKPMAIAREYHRSHTHICRILAKAGLYAPVKKTVDPGWGSWKVKLPRDQISELWDMYCLRSKDGTFVFTIIDIFAMTDGLDTPQAIYLAFRRNYAEQYQQIKDLRNQYRHWTGGLNSKTAATLFYDGSTGLGRFMIDRGWQPLTEEQIRDIRADPRPSRVIASEYGYHFSTICRIKRGESYVAVEGPAAYQNTGIGEANSQAKLTEQIVRDIWELINDGWKNTEIAKKYDVSHQLISQIRRGVIWRHVKT